MNNIHTRLRSERTRLNLAQAKVAKYLGVCSATVLHWEINVSIPAQHLASLISYGCDAMYVLTGRRSTELLSPEETHLLDIFGAISDVQQNAISAFLENLSGQTSAGKAVVEQLKARGYTMAMIGRKLGVSRQAVHQTVHDIAPIRKIKTFIEHILSTNAAEGEA